MQVRLTAVLLVLAACRHMCSSDQPPVYWRELDGVLEVAKFCGPVPLAPEWTLCDIVDTPEQPDECKCLCQ